MLIEHDSIAIWNKNKVVIAITTTLWALYLAFLIEGKSFSVLSPSDKRGPL